MKMIPYPSYKNSEIKWLGEIPDGWEYRKIKQFSKLATGSTPDSGNEIYWDGDITWVTPADLSIRHKYISDSKRTITKKGYLSCGTTFIDEGAIILATRAPIGYPTIVNKTLCFNQGCKSFKIEKDFIPDYCYYFLNAYEDVLNSLGNVTTFGELSTYNFASFHILKPSIKEQNTIASFLDRKTTILDKLITKNKNLIELLKEKRTVLINRAVTKGLDPDVKMKDSGIEWIGEIPEGWDVHKLKYRVLEKKIKESIRNPNTKFIGLEHIESKTGRLLSFSSLDNIDGESIKFDKDSVLLGKLRPYLAKVVLVDFEGSCTGELIVYKSKKGVSSKFLYYRLISTSFIDLINSMTYGVKMPRVDPTQLSNIKIPWPSKNEQNNISNYLNTNIENIDKSIIKLENKIELLKEYKKSLIHHVVTGKIDVRGIKV